MTKCLTCAAKDETIAAKQQTITLLADLIDYMRMQAGPQLPQLPMQPPATSVASVASVAEPKFELSQSKLWVPDDEEEILAQLENGAIDTTTAEKMLAGVQAMNQTVEVVR